MKLGLDEYAYLESPLHRWEARAKLVGLVVLIFAFSFVEDLRLLPAMYAVTLGLFWLSKIPGPYLLSRLKIPGYFLLALAILLPFTAGETILFALGPIALRLEGLLSVLLIASRFVCIITVTLILFGTAPFITSIKAMRSLGLPIIMADMILLTYRYLFEISDHMNTMRTAIRLRGFKGTDLSRRNLTVLASLVGSLLVRSYEQSEQIYKAMVLRGYGEGQMAPDEFQTQTYDIALAGLMIAIALAFVAGQLWLS